MQVSHERWKELTGVDITENLKRRKAPKYYIVENEEAPINNWGCYWVVKAPSKKEAIDKVYNDEAKWMEPKKSGILKIKLEAFEINEKLLGDEGVYCIH